MAFAQLAHRESLRDIEICLTAQSAKLYHMGLSQPVKRATLADANERRDWRIFAEFAQCLIDEARSLYLDEPFGEAQKNGRHEMAVGSLNQIELLFKSETND